MKRLLIFIPLFFFLSARAQYCGPYTFHANISETGHSFETISGDSLNVGNSAGIYLYNCHDIHITKCKFVNGTTVNGVGVYLLGCYNITIDTCYFEGTASGAYVQLSTNNLIFRRNHVRNMRGPYPRGQMIQLNSCTGSGILIENNISWNDPGVGNYEDHINIYKSNGSNTSPIIIQDNWIYGGGPSSTGSGITLADNGGSYQTALHNIVVNSGHVGMQVAGGTYIAVEYNTIYSEITLNSHVGLGYGNYSGLPTNNVLIGHNTIQWRAGYPPDSANWPHGQRWCQFDTSYAKTGVYAVTRPSDWTTNIGNAPIDSTVLFFPLWLPCSNITFPALAARTYGDGDFDPGATSPAAITYASSDTTAAKIILNRVRIIKAGSVTIYATNAYGTASRSLTINKAPLAIFAQNETRLTGVANPVFTADYYGFVLGETPSALTTPPTLSTTAIISSPAGNYVITNTGAAALNYLITSHNAVLTVLTRQKRGPVIKIKAHVL